MLKINQSFFRYLLKMLRRLVDRVDDCVSVGKRPNFHAAIDSTREHSTKLVDLNLCHSLAHVLEETAVLVFAGVEEEGRAHWCSEGPNLFGVGEM